MKTSNQHGTVSYAAGLCIGCQGDQDGAVPAWPQARGGRFLWSLRATTNEKNNVGTQSELSQSQYLLAKSLELCFLLQLARNFPIASRTRNKQ